MNKDLLIVFVVAAGLMIMQSVGGILQIRGYREAIKRMHALGNVGMGQKRGFFFNGHVVVLAADSKRRITGCEVLQGSTIFARFKPLAYLLEKKITEQTIDFYLEQFRLMSQHQQKRYKGYIQALEALEMRFEREQNNRE